MGTVSYKDIVRVAQRIYVSSSSNNIEILDHALVTRSGTCGYWIAANVYISQDDIKHDGGSQPD
jgi:hypothetical protein